VASSILAGSFFFLLNIRKKNIIIQQTIFEKNIVKVSEPKKFWRQNFSAKNKKLAGGVG